jgi:hypothetical protein
VVEKFMPTDLTHRIGIAAPSETIYSAITTEKGIKAWWTVVLLAFAISLTAAAQSPTNRNSAATGPAHPNYDWILHRNCGIHMTIRDVDCRDFDVEAMAKEFSRLHVDYFSFFAAGYVTTYPTSLEFERLSP